MCRQMVRKLTQQIKFTLVDQTKMITAASELSRNTVVYGGGGEMRWEIVQQRHRDGPAPGVRGQGPRHPRHRPGADRRLDLRHRHGRGPVGQPPPGQRLRPAHGRRRRHLRHRHALEVSRDPAPRHPGHGAVAGRRGAARRDRGWPSTHGSRRDGARPHRASSSPSSATTCGATPRTGRLLIGCRKTRRGLPARGDLASTAGPGMADVARCLRDGYSSGGTPGTGLGAVQRLSDRLLGLLRVRARAP